MSKNHTDHSKKHVQKLPISIYIVLGMVLCANIAVVIIMLNYFM